MAISGTYMASWVRVVRSYIMLIRGKRFDIFKIWVETIIRRLLDRYWEQQLNLLKSKLISLLPEEFCYDLSHFLMTEHKCSQKSSMVREIVYKSIGQLLMLFYRSVQIYLVCANHRETFERVTVNHNLKHSEIAVKEMLWYVEFIWNWYTFPLPLQKMGDSLLSVIIQHHFNSCESLNILDFHIGVYFYQNNSQFLLYLISLS